MIVVYNVGFEDIHQFPEGLVMAPSERWLL